MTEGLIKKIEFIGITLCYQTSKKGDVREPSSEIPTCDILASVCCLYILNICYCSSKSSFCTMF